MPWNYYAGNNFASINLCRNLFCSFRKFNYVQRACMDICKIVSITAKLVTANIYGTDYQFEKNYITFNALKIITLATILPA